MATVELQHDTACVRCGYNLRGLSHAGICPECGAPVSYSLAGWSLRHAAPEWRHRIARGLTFLHWSLGAVLLWPLGIIAAYCIEAAVRRSEHLPIAERLLEASPVAGVVAALLGCIGILWTTSGEPTEIEDRDRRRARHMTRWASLALAANGGALIAIRRLPFRLTGGVDTALWISAAILFGLVGLAFSRWLRSLLRRVCPDMVGWAQIATALTLAFTVCLTAYAISLAVASVRGYSALLSDLVGCLVLLVLALGLASLGLVILLIRTLRRELRKADTCYDSLEGAEL